MPEPATTSTRIADGAAGNWVDRYCPAALRPYAKLARFDTPTICNVIDAAELCRSAHASAEWRQVANETFQQLQQYIATLNADRRLYQALVMVEREYGTELTEEESRFCFLLQREFELDGIHLPEEQRTNVQTLHEHMMIFRPTSSIGYIMDNETILSQ